MKAKAKIRLIGLDLMDIKEGEEVEVLYFKMKKKEVVIVKNTKTSVKIHYWIPMDIFNAFFRLVE